MDGNKHQKVTIFERVIENMRLSKTVLNLVFISALVILLTVNILSYKQVQTLIKANKWVTHTHQVIAAIDSTLYDLVDIESRQRAYLLRGLDQILLDIDFIKSHLNQNLDELVRLTKDNPGQNKRVTRFLDLIEQRLSLLNQAMQLKTSNKLDSIEGMNLLNQSQDSSNRVKGLGQEMKSVEQVLLNERNAEAVSDAKISNYVLVAGSIISLFSLVVAFILANIELSIRKKSEKHNDNTQLRLRKIIESASDMIAALDKNFRFIIFNEAYQREFKYIFDKNITVNTSLDDVFSSLPESKHHLIQSWKDSLQGSEYTKTLEFKSDDEKNIYEMSSNLIQHGDNEIQGIVHSIRNITKKIQEHSELQDSYEKLAVGMKELQDKNEQITLLVEMSDIMLACSSQEELSNVTAKYSQRLLQFASGYLFVMHPSKNYLEKATSWGNPQSQELTFTPDQCWAIRLGRIHHVRCSNLELICDHIHTDDKQDLSLFCVPLMAQNDIYGLLYLEICQENFAIDENKKLLITAFAELTALALANVRLRENLRYQSIRDPLTGLYNRRYLEDFLFKQIHQSERTKTSFAILMLDLDHFKKINDNYGHDAGDAVLKEVGTILQSDIRLGDVAARYGGEEFIVLFYDVDIEIAKTRAEELRTEVSKVQIKYGAQQVGHITLSIGIAMYPGDAKTSAELIEAADKALYNAKNNGRNQAIAYSEIDN